MASARATGRPDSSRIPWTVHGRSLAARRICHTPKLQVSMQAAAMLTSVCITLFLFYSCARARPQPQQPVVIDTDIGSDIDDSFAIVFAAQLSHLDVKLVVTCTDDTTARAKIVGQLLTLAGRDDIPIGIGVKNDNKTNHPLFDWARHFDLSTYKGGVFEDGVGKMAEVILNSDSTVDIIAIGPMTNFPSLLSKYPGVVKKARIRAMAGSIKRGYDNSTTPTAEYNVRLCPLCMTLLLQAGWDITLTPLDTCGVAYLTPTPLQFFIASVDAASNGLGSSLLYFCSSVDCHLQQHTTPIYDAVATLLTLSSAADFVEFEELNITVTSDGHTVVNNSGGHSAKVALYWKSPDGLDHFRNYLVDTLSGQGNQTMNATKVGY